MFEQLDELKVSVCSAPDGQYYETSGGEYGRAGTVEGPSLDEIEQSKENLGFKGEETHTFVDVCETSTEKPVEDHVEDNRPRNSAYISELKNENNRLKREIQQLKAENKRILATRELQPKHIDEVELCVDNGIVNGNETEKLKIDDTTVDVPGDKDIEEESYM